MKGEWASQRPPEVAKTAVGSGKAGENREKMALK